MIPHVHGSGCSRWVQLCVSARAISYYHKDRVSCHRTFTGNQTKNIFRINKTRNYQKNVHSYLKIYFFLHFSGDHDLFSFCQIPVKQLISSANHLKTDTRFIEENKSFESNIVIKQTCPWIEIETLPVHLPM